MRAHSFTEYDCLQACKKSPLATLAPGKQHSIQDLLLSNIAVGSDVTLEQVTTALNELIDLKYPLINRVLEVAAYFCSLKGLHIYCANSEEYSSLSLTGRDVGYFNPNMGLIVVSTKNPLSQVLIHELAHAVRFFIGIAEEPTLKRHREFCRHKFSTLFNQASKNINVTKEEQQELNSIEANATAVREIAVEYSRHCSRQDWETMMERSREGSDIFHIRRRNVQAHQEFRREFYNRFKPCQESDRAEEFLSMFLQHFVAAAHHKKVGSLQTWVVKYMKAEGDHLNQSYYASLLRMMWSSLPELLVKDFIKDDFRTALDHYAAMLHLSAPRLQDSLYYSGTLAEPNRINNSFRNI